jgi:hypothetical protein
MSKSPVQQEIDLRIEEITIKIRELMKIADDNDVNFSLNIIDKEFYCEKYINEDEYLRDYHGNSGGQWLSSSDFC